MRGQLEKNTIIALLIIVTVGIILRILSYGGYHGTDDTSYTQIAHDIATGKYFSGDYSGLPIFKLRFVVTVPAALGFILFGVNSYTLIAYPFILSLFGIVIAFFIGKAIYGEKTGLIAALIAAVIPLDMRLASELQPNLPGAFWANLGILLLILGSKQEKPRLIIIQSVMAGLAFGLSWLCKSSVVFLLPFVIGWLAWLMVRERNNRSILPVFLITFILVLVVESVFHYSYSLDPFFRFNVTEENYRLSKTWFFAEGTPFGWAPGEYYPALLKRVFNTGPKVIFMDSQFGGTTALALVSVVCSIYWKQRALLLPSFWFVSLVLMFNFGSTSFLAYTPLPLFPAHLFPLLLPATLLVAGMFHDSVDENKGTPKKQKVIITVVYVVVLVLVCANGFWRNFLDGPQSRLEAESVKIASPSDTVFTDRRTIYSLKFFWKFPEETDMHDLAGLDTIDIPPVSYVLINRYRLEFLAEFYDYELPEFYNNVPGGWEKVYENRNGELYLTPPVE